LKPWTLGLGLVVVLVTLGTFVLLSGGHDAPTSSEFDAGLDGPDIESSRSSELTSQPNRHAPPPLPSADDLDVLALGDAGMARLAKQEFRQNAGIKTVGADPEGARAEVKRPGWSKAMVEELRGGFDALVAGPGVELDRLECERGRCLVEVQYDAMARGFDSAEALGFWLTERVRCRAYSDGLDPPDSPTVSPSQQIWVLCGEP